MGLSVAKKPLAQNVNTTISDSTTLLKDKFNVENIPNYRQNWTIYTDTLTADTFIYVEEYIFHAHKDILSYYSSSLRSFFKNNEINKVTLKNISPKVLQILLNYMYTNSLKVTCQTINEIYTAAQKLGIKNIIVHCIELFTSGDASSYIYRYAAAWEQEMITEKYKAYKLIMKNFETCIKTKEFFNLHIGQVCEIFIGASIDWIESNIESHYSLFLVALKWIEENRNERIRHSVTIMACVPFHKMKKEDVIRCFTPPLGDSVIKLQPVKNILISVLQNVTGQNETVESLLKANKIEI